MINKKSSIFFNDNISIWNFENKMYNGEQNWGNLSMKYCGPIGKTDKRNIVCRAIFKNNIYVIWSHI